MSTGIRLRTCLALVALAMVWPSASSAADADLWGPAAIDAEVQQAPARELSRGEALLRLGQLAQAAHAFRRVLAVQPDDTRTLERLRRAAIEAHETTVLHESLTRLCDLYLAEGGAEDATLAEERFQELMALDPQTPERARFEQALGRVGARPAASGLNLGGRLRSLLGIFAILGLAWLVSKNRKQIRLSLVAWGMALQVVFAMLILWTPPGRGLFELLSKLVYRVLRFTDDGAGFVFGKLYQGAAPGLTTGPVQVVDGTSGDFVNLGMIFALHVLPTIVFFSALMALLYHLKIVQVVVRGIAWVMIRTMRTSGAETLCAAANIFIGQSEAPLVIRPYVAGMTASELWAVMVGGFATSSAGMMAVYAQVGADPGHLLAASVMSAPASLVIAKMLLPETGVPETQGGRVHDPPRDTANAIDATAGGAADGMRLALNVAAMLIAFISMIAMVNWGLSWVGGLFSHPELSLRVVFGYLFYPLSWCLGVDTPDLLRVGNLVGTMLSVNEFVAFVDLSRQSHLMSPRSVTIATYALCSMANLGSIAIQIGGISAIASSRRADLARFGFNAMLAGAMASCLTACIAGILI